MPLGIFLSSDLSGRDDGVQGWSVSLLTDPDVQLVDVTLSGTAGDEAPTGYLDGGFEKTEVVDPTLEENFGRTGAVSAVVLCFGCQATLPPVSDELILRVLTRVDTTAIVAPGDTIGPYIVRPTQIDEPGLRGSGRPVKTAPTVNGNTRTPTTSGVSLQIVGEVQPLFLRGDANEDTRVNIADAIWIVSELFADGPTTGCRDAADVNDDGLIDISDGLFLIGYRFQAGAPPSSPFPGCGPDPSDDEVGCLVSHQDC